MSIIAASPAAGDSRTVAHSTVTTSRGTLDLVVYAPAADPPKPPAPKPLALVLSGEGGWRAFDDLVAGWLAGAGYWTGGFDAKAYFSDPQDDRQAFVKDLRAYAAQLEKAASSPPGSPLLLVGFSFGADLAPWIAGAGGWERGRIAAIVMLGPDEVGSTQFRWTEMLGLSQPTDHVFDTAEALRSAAGTPMLFIHGGADSKSSVPKLAAAAPEPKTVIVVPGANHHFTGKEDDLRKAFLDGIDRLLAARQPR